MKNTNKVGMLGQIDARTGPAASVVHVPQLVFDPGSVGPLGPNVFADFSELMDTFAQTPGQVGIFFPADCTIPAGAYDFEQRGMLMSSHRDDPSQVTVALDAAGVALANLREIYDIHVRQDGVGPAMTLIDNEGLLLFHGGVISSTNGPLVLLAGAADPATIIGAFGGQARSSGGAEPIEVADASIGAYFGLVESGTDNDTVKGAASALFLLATDDTPSNVNPTYAGFLGTIVELLFSTSVYVSYSAAVPANWAGTSPTSVKEALDRIAAALGPIP